MGGSAFIRGNNIYINRDRMVENRSLTEINHEILHYILHEAYPIQMGDLTVAWAETDSYSILPIQFTFRTYDILKEDITDTHMAFWHKNNK